MSSLGKTPSTLLVLLLFPLAGVAEDAWKNKPPAQWSEKETLKLLTDSPWARPVTLWPVTGRRVKEVEPQRRVYQDAADEPPLVVTSERVQVAPEVVEARYVVRWSSAAIVQQARERLRQVAAPAVADLHAFPPEVPPRHIVLTVQAVTPSAAPTPLLFDTLNEPQLRARARLRTSKKRTVEAGRVLPHGTGAGAALSFFFPRVDNSQPLLEPGTDWVEFELVGATGDKLKAKFKLKEMQVSGQPNY